MSGSLPGYVLHEVLGEGSAAVVWRAEPEGRPGRVVAVKRLRGPVEPGAVAELRREADALERLSHPSILRLLDVVDDGGGVALVLPYAPGGSLAARIAAADPQLSAAAVADLGARLGRALAAAHAAGIVHRDVKPANVLFDAEGQPLLADLGTARLHGQSAPIEGTAAYLAPEVAGGHPPDALADVYGLGVTCYEALAGTPPYARSTPEETVRAAQLGRHPPLADLVEAPASLTDAVERAMARARELRPSTAAALAADLDEARRELEAAGEPTPVVGGRAPTAGAAVPPWASGTAPPTVTGSHADGSRAATRRFGPRPPARPRHAPPPRRRWRIPLLALAALAVLAVPVGLVWWLWGGGEPREAAAPPDPDGERVERTPPPPCADVESPDVEQGLELLPGDVAGRGCAVPVGWDGRVLHVPRADESPRRYELDAEPDDELLLGDWTCDEHDTPALYRPATGEVFVFDEFAAGDEEVVGRVEDSGVVDGAPVVLTDGSGCDRVEVEPG